MLLQPQTMSQLLDIGPVQIGHDLVFFRVTHEDPAVAIAIIFLEDLNLFFRNHAAASYI